MFLSLSNLKKSSIFVLCFFFHDGRDYVLLGDEYDARYSRPFGKHVDVSRYKIKDDFQFKNRIWYNSEIYNWLLLLIIVGSFFVPLDDHAMIAIMLGSAIGIPVLYFSVRIYIHFKFKSMAKQIIKYHQHFRHFTVFLACADQYARLEIDYIALITY